MVCELSEAISVIGIIGVICFTALTYNTYNTYSTYNSYLFYLKITCIQQPAAYAVADDGYCRNAQRLPAPLTRQ